jgi:hypothetical protein
MPACVISLGEMFMRFLGTRFWTQIPKKHLAACTNLSVSHIVFTTLETSQRLGHDVPDEHTIAQRIQGTRPSMLCDFCLVEGK